MRRLTVVRYERKRVVAASDLDDVRADLLGAVGEMLRPAYASLWLRRDRQ